MPRGDGGGGPRLSHRDLSENLLGQDAPASTWNTPRSQLGNQPTNGGGTRGPIEGLAPGPAPVSSAQSLNGHSMAPTGGTVRRHGVLGGLMHRANQAKAVAKVAPAKVRRRPCPPPAPKICSGHSIGTGAWGVARSDGVGVV